VDDILRTLGRLRQPPGEPVGSVQLRQDLRLKATASGPGGKALPGNASASRQHSWISVMRDWCEHWPVPPEQNRGLTPQTPAPDSSFPFLRRAV
jgi:hypothetical protein